MAAGRGDLRQALEKAKDASAKERSLIRQREQASLSEGHNLDLTYSVSFTVLFFKGNEEKMKDYSFESTRNRRVWI